MQIVVRVTGDGVGRRAMSGRSDGSPPGAYPVLVIDDHEMFSTSLTMALRIEGFDAHSLAVTQIGRFHFGGQPRTGLVVLDLNLGEDPDGRRVNGAELVDGMRAQGWKVLVVSGIEDRAEIARAIAGGAIGAVSKSRSFEFLLRTVVAAATGHPLMTELEHQRWLDRHHVRMAQERDVARRLARLSPRERDVLELLADGMRAGAIAKRFVVSISTVRTQIRSILLKLQVSSQLEAAALVRPRPSAGGRRRAGRA